MSKPFSEAHMEVLQAKSKWLHLASKSPTHFLLCRGNGHEVGKREMGRDCAVLSQCNKSKKGLNFGFISDKFIVLCQPSVGKKH